MAVMRDELVREGGPRMKFRGVTYKLAWLAALAVAVGASWRA
jgi:hypothetical protein